MDEPTPTPGQPTGPTRSNLAHALTASVRRSGERSTVFGRILTTGLVVVLAGALAVGIGALAIHHKKDPKTANAANKELDPAKRTPPKAGAPVPVPIAPPGRVAPGHGARKPTGKATPGAAKAKKGSAQNPSGASSGQGSGQSAKTFQAANVPTTTIVSNATGKCIDVTNEGQTGVPIQIWNCDPVTDWKRWSFYSDGTIRSMGNCMTVAGSANGTPIEVRSCTGGSSQRFTLNSASDLVNVAADKCVDVKDKQTGNGTPLQLWSCGGTSNQKWHTS